MPPSVRGVGRWRDADGSRDWFTMDDVVLKQPLDWCEEDWADELSNLGR
jgi:hypothetical protein